MKKLLAFFTLSLLIALPVFSQSSIGQSTAQSFALYGVVLLLAGGIVLLLFVFRPKELPRIEDSSRYLELKSGFEQQKSQIASLTTSEASLRQLLSDAQAQAKTRENELTSLNDRLSEHKAKETQVQSERKTESTILENARKTLENERERVIAEETKHRKEDEENRDRVWAMHETEAILRMKEICQKPNLLITSYDNTNLPDDFDPSLKPDFMIRLLDQYVVFDPKLSKPDNLQTYIATQARRTAEKFRKSSSFEALYKSVYFVVPSLALQYLRQFSYYEQGFMFYVIPVESFEPILTTLKRLEEYDLADKYDPQERENIVNLIAAFEQHIRQQNATNILSAMKGLRVLAEKQLIPEDVVDAIEAARRSIKITNLKPTDLKRLVENPDSQMEEISRLLKGPKRNLDESDFTGEASPAK